MQEKKENGILESFAYTLFICALSSSVLGEHVVAAAVVGAAAAAAAALHCHVTVLLLRYWSPRETHTCGAYHYHLLRNIIVTTPRKSLVATYGKIIINNTYSLEVYGLGGMRTR